MTFCFRPLLPFDWYLNKKLTGLDRVFCFAGRWLAVVAFATWWLQPSSPFKAEGILFMAVHSKAMKSQSTTDWHQCLVDHVPLGRVEEGDFSAAVGTVNSSFSGCRSLSQVWGRAESEVFEPSTFWSSHFLNLCTSFNLERHQVFKAFSQKFRVYKLYHTWKSDNHHIRMRHDSNLCFLMVDLPRYVQRASKVLRASSNQTVKPQYNCTYDVTYCYNI